MLAHAYQREAPAEQHKPPTSALRHRNRSACSGTEVMPSTCDGQFLGWLSVDWHGTAEHGGGQEVNRHHACSRPHAACVLGKAYHIKVLTLPLHQHLILHTEGRQQ